MLDLKIYTAKHFNTDAKLLKKVADFIYSGKEVRCLETLIGNLLRIKILFALYLDNTLIGTIAIKNPSKEYIGNLFECDETFYNYKEIGYCVIDERFRNNSYAKLLNQIAFNYAKIKKLNFFITVRKNNMPILNILNYFSNYYKKLKEIKYNGKDLIILVSK